jgi:histone H3/H4
VIPTFGAPPPIQQSHNLQAYQNNQDAFGGDFEQYGNNTYMPPIPALPPSHSFANAPPTTSPFFQQNNTDPQRRLKSEYDPDYLPSNTTLSPKMSSRGPRIKSDPSSSSSHPLATQQYSNPNPLGIEIKTKFPVARIKRIMQADEEVGKVASTTPTAVNKALELFMIALVTGAAERAREKGGKRVTAQHMKAVVEGNPERFDFLNEIVGKVSDVQEGAGGEGKKKRKEVAGDSSESEEEKKPKKGRGRKKKTDD